MMLGIAMFTIVVSRGSMKNPKQSTTRSNPGFLCRSVSICERRSESTSEVKAGAVGDDGVEWCGVVGLSSTGGRRFDAGQIRLERRSGAGDGAHGVLGPILIVPMQDDLVADRYQVPGGQLAKSISRTGDE